MYKDHLPHGVSACRFLLTALCILLFAGNLRAAGDEEYMRKKISVQATNESIEQVLDKISKLADIRFFYNYSVLDFSRKITVNIKDTELHDALSKVLQGEKVEIEYQPNRTVVLRPQRVPDGISAINISGKIIDADTKEPLIGASVVLKEQKGVGVVTDIDGKFHITIPEGGASALLISYVGYENEELAITGQGDMKDLTIKMTAAFVEMEGVVVTGMAPRKSESFTGSYVSVKGEELKKLSPNNLLQALQFFDPSFRIVENNKKGSDPNAMPEFQMRGNVQLDNNFSNSDMNMLVGNYSNQPNMPLFVLDGFETTLQKIVDLDPERVASITILKDASATAIYGSRAANGVVVFETKKPLSGALNVTYSMSMGITMPDLSSYDMMNAAEKLQFEYDAGLFSNDANGNPLSGSILAEQRNYYNHYKREIERGVNTYWLSEPVRTAIIHRHTLTVDGGDEALRYNLNLNYGNEPGVIKESGRETFGFSLNLQYRRKKWNISNQLSIDNTKGTNSPYGSFSEYVQMNPYYTKRDEYGNYQKIIERKSLGPGNGSKTITNPLYNTQFEHKDYTKNFNVTDNFSLEFAIRENLRLNAQFSLTKGTFNGEIFKSMNHSEFEANDVPLLERGTYNKSIGNTLNWNTNASINYNLTKDKHLLSMFARWEIGQNQSDGIFLTAKGFPNDNMSDFQFAQEVEKRDVNNTESTSRSMGLTATVSYMYDFRYSVDFNVRGDMSSQFGADSKLKPFWSVGARWNASREKWLEGTAISNLVLRTSYGITGSQNYDPYQAIEGYTFEEMMFQYLSSGVIGSKLKGFGNPDLDWSTTEDFSAAIELGFFNDRLTASVNYYNHYTDQLLLENNIAPSSGFLTMTNNIGAISNKGVDVTLGFTPIQDFERQIQWNVSINGNHNKNVVKKLSNEIKKQNENNLNERNSPAPIYEEGKSTSQLFVVRSLGIDPATGNEIFLKRNGERTFFWDANDKVAVGDTEPKFRGGITSSLTWKEWSLNLGFTYQLGAYIYNQTLVDRVENVNLAYNVDRRAAKDRWRKPGDIAKYKSISYTGRATELSSRFVQKVNEIQFSSISVGYHFDPKKFTFLKQCKIAGINLTGSMQDLGRLSSVKQERGTDYPFSRTVNLSLSVLFN